MYPAPSHLKNIVKNSDHSIRTKVFKEYGEYTTVFCLDLSVSQLKANWLEEYESIGGVLMVKNHANIKTLIFDSSKHGYNGQFDLEEPPNNKTMKEISLTGSLSEKTLILAFQYGGDEKDYAEENNSEFPEDYFDWFSVYELVNGKLLKVYEYECA
ncbi:hypothetical protein L3049_11295 [Labilibaculum sp. DW002]|uniref:Uncharacterized protein n=1 Tax=Paralabilibaculum antarcticum TaxID=2912572 RepID=A0ABT5VTF3_9BACT|nr:hypothetical protein [Labilibaculum sp. DW002]MDE5418592.1 hypothetical protein [Labilibaculum sp. DW002]